MSTIHRARIIFSGNTHNQQSTIQEAIKINHTLPTPHKIILPPQLEELRHKEIWLNFCAIYNPKKHGGAGGYDKPPVNPRTLGNGSSTDPKSWTDFDTANDQIGKQTRIFYKSGRLDTYTVYGVGLVLEPAGIMGVDLDQCIRRDATGRISATAEAKAIWKKLNSYTERSLSGDGIHILVYAKKPNNDVCRINVNGTEIELYDNARYFTFSGRPLKGCDHGVEHREKEVGEIYNLILSKKAEREQKSLSVIPCNSGGSGERATANESDAELWQKMFSSKEGYQIKSLYDGNTNGDHSRADLALCCFLAYWTNNDSGRIDAMFRQSGLMRAKWDRDDYRAWTINEAIKRTPTYRGFSAEEKKAYAQKKQAEETERAFEMYAATR